jgi:hypothetical protein
VTKRKLVKWIGGKGEEVASLWNGMKLPCGYYRKVSEICYLRAVAKVVSFGCEIDFWNSVILFFANLIWSKSGVGSIT